MKKIKSYITATLILSLTLFAGYSIYLISKPMPLEIQGEVEAKQIKVASKLIGRIESLQVSKGQDVKKGDVLFQIKSPEIEAKVSQAEAVKKAAVATKAKAFKGARSEDIQAAYNNWRKASAAADFAKKTFTRINNLYAEGVVPEQKRDEAEAKMKAAVETQKAAEALHRKAKNGAQIEDKDAAGALVDQASGVLSEVNSYMDETTIKSPISGEISNIIAEQGELVPSGFPVVTIVDLSDTWVRFHLREDLLVNISKGSKFIAKVPALGNKKIELEVSFINSLGAYATWNATKTNGDFDMKTFEIHARPTDKSIAIRPGMSVLVNWDEVTKG